jgi:hypothetical protein
MKTRRQRPLRRQLKVESMSARQPHDVAKIWIIIAVCAVITGSLLIFNPFKLRPFGSGSATNTATQKSQAKQAPPLAPPDNSNNTSMLTETKPVVQQGTIAASTNDSTAVAVPTAAPSANSAPQVDPKTSVSDKEFLEGKPSTAPVRKNVEKQRRQAERKRARLEEMYQKHEISSEAYKKGQEEYRAEIGKYRNEATGKDPANG